MSFLECTPLSLIEEDFGKIHDGLARDGKSNELMVFDLLCIGLRPTEISECEAVKGPETSGGYLIVHVKKSKDSIPYKIPIRKLNTKWLAQFEMGDLFEKPLTAHTIAKMVKGWSVYLDSNKVLAIRDFRQRFSEELFTSYARFPRN